MTKEQAILAFGTARALAEAIGVTEQAVSQWGETVPELRVYQIKAILAERAS
jgi:DNA-binding transcriptional regulator YdaS (Cro superfamily)